MTTLHIDFIQYVSYITSQTLVLFKCKRVKFCQIFVCYKNNLREGIGVVYPNISICRKCPDLQDLRDVDEFVSSLELIWTASEWVPSEWDKQMIKTSQ